MEWKEKKVRRGDGRIANNLKGPTNEKTKEQAKNKPRT
jgi:hypothetical protein